MSDSSKKNELDEYGVWVKTLSPKNEELNLNTEQQEDTLPDFSFLDRVAQAEQNSQKQQEVQPSGEEEISLDEFITEGFTEPDDVREKIQQREVEAAAQKEQPSEEQSDETDEVQEENAEDEIIIPDTSSSITDSHEDGDISLDDFLDGGFSEPAEMETPEHETSLENEDNSPLDIDLSFDDEPADVSTDESDSGLDEFDFTNDTANSSFNSGSEEINLSDFGFTDEGSDTPAVKNESESSGSNEEIDLSEFGFTEEDANSQSTKADSEVPEKKEETEDYEMNVSTDDNNVIETVAATSSDDSEEVNLSFEQDNEEKETSSEENKSFGAPDDDFDLDSILDGVDFDSDGSETPSQEENSQTLTAASSEPAELSEEIPTDFAEEPAAQEPDPFDTADFLEETAADTENPDTSNTADDTISFGEEEPFLEEEPVIEETEESFQEPFLEEDNTSLEETAADTENADTSNIADDTISFGKEEPFLEEEPVIEETEESFQEPFLTEEETSLEETAADTENPDTEATEEPAPQESDTFDTADFIEETNEPNKTENAEENPVMTEDNFETFLSQVVEANAREETAFEDIPTVSETVPDTFEEETASLVKDLGDKKSCSADTDTSAEKEVYSVFIKENAGTTSPAEQAKEIPQEETEAAPEKHETSGSEIQTTDLLKEISNQIANLKDEISVLKNKMADLSANQPAEKTEDKAEEVEIPVAASSDSGFFSETDEDDTIALSGDELNNILNTADFTATEEGESAIPEDTAEPPLPESESEETEETEETLDFDNESFEEPDFSDEIPVNEEETEQSEEEISVPKVDDILVESSSSDLMDAEIRNDNVQEEEELSEITEDDIPSPTLESLSNPIDLFKEEKPEEVLTDESIEYLSKEPQEEITAEPELAEEDEEQEIIEEGISDSPVNDVFANWQASSPENESAGTEEIDVAENDDLQDISISKSELDALEEKSKNKSEEKEFISSELKDEIKSVLSYMDQLLESLPEEKIEEFAKSEYFETYKKLFKDLGIS
ncbi:MAG: hypothetical protein PUI24_05495 [Spirochaetales bacterium]|nr:hypothetical protein [Spirochaetales bacterium]